MTQFLANGTPTSTIATIVGDRSLQGQSDHLANLQIGYEDFESNSRATILVNYTSERIQQIEEGGGTGSQRVVEQPPILVDFVWSRDLEIAGGDYTLDFKIGNILGDDYDAKQVSSTGDEIVFDTYDIGRTFELGLTRRF